MSNPQNYWLVAAQVITSKEGVERSKGLNTLVKSEKNHFTKLDIAAAQQTVMRRFVNECRQIKGAQIVDVFIQSVSFLGNMTEEEYNAGFKEAEAVGKHQGVQGLN